MLSYLSIEIYWFINDLLYSDTVRNYNNCNISVKLLQQHFQSKITKDLISRTFLNKRLYQWYYFELWQLKEFQKSKRPLCSTYTSCFLSYCTVRTYVYNRYGRMILYSTYFKLTVNVLINFTRLSLLSVCLQRE